MAVETEVTRVCTYSEGGANRIDKKSDVARERKGSRRTPRVLTPQCDKGSEDSGVGKHITTHHLILHESYDIGWERTTSPPFIKEEMGLEWLDVLSIQRYKKHNRSLDFLAQV